jgi:hypothetical protein
MSGSQNLLSLSLFFLYWFTDECVNNSPSVFKLNSRPWIDPDARTLEEITNTIRKCPSGALSYSIDGINYKDQNERKPIKQRNRTLIHAGPNPIELIKFTYFYIIMFASSL